MASSSSINPLGDLSKLPPELRLHIYSFVLPESFTQTFKANQDAEGCMRLGYLSSTQYYGSAPIGLLYTSNTIRDEAVQAITVTQTWKVTIMGDLMLSNMPLFDPFLTPQQGGFTVPRCKDIHIAVKIPSPRTAPSFVEVRKTVEAFATMLNAADSILPSVTASLPSEHRATWVNTYNDFAMLLAPLGRLRNHPGAATVVCSSPLTPGMVDPASLQQCQLIEAAMQEPSDSQINTLRLLLQQLFIDVKLELMFYANEVSLAAFATRYGESPRPVRLGSARAARLRRRLTELNHLLNTNEAQVTSIVKGASDYVHGSRHRVAFDGLSSLFSTVVNDGRHAIVSNEVLGRVVDAARYSPTDYSCWASGHLTARNPFWRVW